WLYPNFSSSPQHSPPFRLLLSSFWISNGPPQKVILMWSISPPLQSVSQQHSLL
ncbi:hypothetical protein Goari_005520, partial [Gossypium aridum]|nr:hypothetical protein [Gossypium aridum]